MRAIDVLEDRVQAAVFTMRRRGSPLRFVFFPMIHVATPSFYAEVRRLLTSCDLIVAEGGRGRSRPLTALTLAYRLAPRFRRRSLQLQDYGTLLPPGVPVIYPDVSAEEFLADLRYMPRWEYWLMLAVAPVGGLVFAVCGPRPFLTRHLMVELPTVLRPEVLRAEAMRDAMRRKGIAVDDPFTAANRRREQMLLDALTAIHEERHDQPIAVAVVYGAGHAPVVVRGLMIRHGYRVREAQLLTVFHST
jgi:hypothetical protein